MKLMYCAKCASTIVPNKRNLVATSCECGRFSVWWRDGDRGSISVHDKLGEYGLDGDRPVCYLLGINNNLLTVPGVVLEAADYQALIDKTPPSYLFSSRRSLIVRFMPGHSADSMWAGALPATIPAPGRKVIILNGKTCDVDAHLSYEQVVELAGLTGHPTVTYRGKRQGDSCREGEMHTGCNILHIEDGMIFNVMHTGNA